MVNEKAHQRRLLDKNMHKILKMAQQANYGLNKGALENFLTCSSCLENFLNSLDDENN